MYRREAAINSRSIYFDGRSGAVDRADCVVVGDHDVFSFGDGSGNDKPFTFTAWVYVEAPGSDNGPFITKGNSGGATTIEYIFKHESGVLKAFLYNGKAGEGTFNRLAVTATSATIPASTWAHVALTYDGSMNHAGLKLYTNGALTASNTVENGDYSTDGGTRNTSEPLIIGKTNNNSPLGAQAFEDRMADICIFSKELSATEIAEIYNGGAVKNMAKASTYSDLTSWWKMGDDRDGPLSGGIIDYVGGYNGTLTNGATIALEVDLASDLDPENFQMFTQTSHGKTRQLKFITPPGPRPDYDNILMPLGPSQIESGEAKDTVDTATYPELANAIPSFRTDPDIKLNGVPCSFSTENQRYLIIFQDCLPTLSNVVVQVWGFSYAMPRWSPLYDLYGIEVKQSQNNAVQLGKIYEIAGVDKVCLVNFSQANPGGQAVNRTFDKNTDHISLAVCTF
tara:strand:+ start:24166 stop:25524 length:1359 start_codon:yes stop_codon:yes gene_type:complete